MKTVALLRFNVFQGWTNAGVLINMEGKGMVLGKTENQPFAKPRAQVRDISSLFPLTAEAFELIDKECRYSLIDLTKDHRKLESKA